MGDQNQAGDKVLTATPEVKPAQETASAASDEISEAAQPIPNVASPTNGGVPSEPDGTTQTSPDTKPVPTPAIIKAAQPVPNVASPTNGGVPSEPDGTTQTSLDTKPAPTPAITKAAQPIPNVASPINGGVPSEPDGTTQTSLDTKGGVGAMPAITKVREEENEILKARIASLESELAAALTRPGTKNQEMVDNIKKQHDELLVKARGMIFDKTKMVKNQELQIEALNNQVASLKDVANITKDLLNIRNTEVKHLEERLEAMDEKFRIEKERHQLIVKKIDSGTKMNEELKKEYETQLHLFKELRVKYEERVLALQEENKKLLDSIDKPAASTSQ